MGHGVEGAENLAGDVSLEHALASAGGEPFAGAPVDVVAGRGVVTHAADHDGVQGAVELAVAAAVEAVLRPVA